MSYRISLTIALGVLLLSCSNPAPVDSNADLYLASEELPPKNQAQMLPIGAEVILGGEAIALEVTRTPQQQALGLMYRKSLPENRGMLFSFEQPRYPRFWMKNVEISLDMIFLRDGEVKAIEADVPPCTTTPCPVYGPQTPIDQVIELRGGRASELGLKVGDRVTVEFLDAP